jgi:HAD superfamily hydrolase (TIGR01490 family)
MPHAYAFFDVDGTLLNMKSMFSFHDYWYRRWLPAHSAAASDEFEDVTAILRALTENGSPRELVNRRYYEFFAGRSIEAMAACAKAWARSVLADPGLFIPEVLDELGSLRARGVEPVFVSGSFLEILQPIAEHLGVREVLATRLLQAGGKYTGRFEAPQTIGAGKAVAITAFLARGPGQAAECWAFGDDVSDLPMLEAVGRPVAVIGDPELGAIARARNWRCLHVGADPDQSLLLAGSSVLAEEAV